MGFNMPNAAKGIFIIYVLILILYDDRVDKF